MVRTFRLGGRAAALVRLRELQRERDHILASFPELRSHYSDSQRRMPRRPGRVAVQRVTRRPVIEQ
jgi:hypothetical protein